MTGLTITDLSVQVDQQPILNRLNLHFDDQAIYAITGHNGCGKSTLFNAIMGAPDYRITSGRIQLDQTDLTNSPTDQRAKLGLFLASQYSVEIPGISYGDFLRLSLTTLHDSGQFNMADMLDELVTNAQRLGFSNFNYQRDLNVGFSGGEKKKSEILQMLAIKPRFALLDEPDSGLDSDSVQQLGDVLTKLDYPTTLIVITHNPKLLQRLNPRQTFNLEALNRRG